MILPIETFSLEAPREAVRLPETKAEFQAILKRAEAGDAAAQYLAGCTCLRQGDELMDKLRVLPSGSPYLRAPYNIGDRNPLSDGAQDSYRQAYNWFEKAAAQGSPDALYALSCCCLQGMGTAVHLEKGRRLLEEAAEKGYFRAQFDLGMLYYHGHGEKNAVTDPFGFVAQDYDKAIFWLQKAAAQGDAMALYFLGKCCEEGTGTEQNQPLAVAFYQRAAALDNPWAQCALGRCYEHGLGIKKNIQKATEFYALAAETGDEEAIEALERL